MKKLIALSLLAGTVALTGCLGSSSDNDNNQDDAGTVSQDISIQFAAQVGDQPFSCDTTYANLGTQASQANLTDFRLYLHDVKLIDSDGNRHDVTLTNDGIWQTDRVALLDFETGDGSCGGTAETNGLIKGSVAEGSYTGLEFSVGVPQELNHQDSAAAASPLNISGMFWSWQSGYKHLRIDASVDDASWFFHLGSTDCSGDPTQGEDVSCANPNRPTITLTDFNTEANKVVINYSDLMATSDLSTSTPMPPGCMSGATDPDCTEVMKSIGLNGGTQTLFSQGAL